MTKPADIRTKSADQLDAMLVELHREQFNLRFQRATGEAAGTARSRAVRREIARVKTIQAERVRAPAKS